MQRAFRKWIARALGQPLFAVLVVFAVIPAAAAQPVKQPWAYSFEERIALRTDARLAADRVRGAGRIRVNAQDGTSLVADSFEGRSHAELFLPYEVFRTLVRLSYFGSESGAARYRQAMTPMLEAYGLPADFWERLAVLSAEYVGDSKSIDAMGAEFRQAHARARHEIKAEITRRQMTACSSRAAALEAARNEFGQETFDRFLYEVIAVHMFHVADELPRVDDLRLAERGCR